MWQQNQRKTETERPNIERAERLNITTCSGDGQKQQKQRTKRREGGGQKLQKHEITIINEQKNKKKIPTAS